MATSRSGSGKGKDDEAKRDVKAKDAKAKNATTKGTKAKAKDGKAKKSKGKRRDDKGKGKREDAKGKGKGGDAKGKGKGKQRAGKTGKTRDDYAATYTEPDLRERLKDQIKAGDRGGRPGQWSARKSQLLVREYEQAGGGYRDEDTRTASQRHLEQWGEQDWHADDGSAQARSEDGTERYLPDVAWQLLAPSEQRATRRAKKTAADQHVDNTEAAQEARAAAQVLTDSAVEGAKRVRAMTSPSALDRARRAETEHGRGRKTVLDAIARRERALQA